MLDLAPWDGVHSRAAYLQELYGDPDGAIEFMERAAKVGSAKDPEPLAWCLVQWGISISIKGGWEKQKPLTAML
jgi:hypothetical protein